MALVEAGTPLAQAIQSAVQPKLVEGGWVAEENDTTLSEYVVMMIVNGKTPEQVVSELGTDLLGVGEDDPGVAEFTRWLFSQIPLLAAQANGPPVAQAQDQTMNGGAQEFQPAAQHQEQQDAPQPIQSVADAQMDDAQAPADGVYVYTSSYVPEAYIEELSPRLPTPDRKGFFDMQWRSRSPFTYSSYRPSGPKAMRNRSLSSGGPRGRGGRLLNQLNRTLDRSRDGSDPLLRIKGAASGQTGRINSHAGRDPPRGPRGGRGGINKGGLERAMNGGPQNAQLAGMMQQAPNGMMTSSQQMQFLQMMEMQSQMMAQMLQQQNGGQAPNVGGAPNFQQNGRGGKKSLFDRVDKGINKSRPPRAQQQGDHIATASESGMDVDPSNASDDSGLRQVKERKDPFDTVCRFNDKCTVPTCPYAHQSPAAPPGTTMDLTDRCSFGAACENKKCAGKHPSPAQRRQHLKDEVDCKFYPNCQNPACPFRHPNTAPCRNGADCTVLGCQYSHSKIMCRYNPCLNPQCLYKHAPGQKRGKFEDKVWTPAPGNGEDAGFNMEEAQKMNRFAELQGIDGAGEELIKPEQSSSQQETQITT